MESDRRDEGHGAKGASGWQMFLRLYLKDLRDLHLENLVFVAITVLWDFYLYLKAAGGNWPSGAALALSFMPFGLAAFIPVLESFKILWDEWKHNTVYLLFSLPVSGQVVLLAKLLAVLTQFIFLTLVSGFGSLLLLVFLPWHQLQGIDMMYRLWAGLGRVWGYLAWQYIIALLAMANFTVLAFFSSVVGKLARRLSGLATAVVFILAGYTSGRLVDFLARVAAFVYPPGAFMGHQVFFPGPVFLFRLHQPGGYIGYSGIDPVTPLATLVVLVLFFTVTSAIYNRRLEL